MKEKSISSSTKPGVADIFRQYGAEYRRTHSLPYYQLKAMYAIENCRTKALGGHLYECDQCGHQHILYNSCCNRHCPQCQWLAKEKWLSKQEQNLLPVPYFHAVFTIPDTLNDLAQVNQKVVYKILFRAAKETLLELGKDPKHLGAEIGIIAVLHTWGQNLSPHLHLHCIVPGGGLSFDGKHWVSMKKGFFVHVDVLSALFKGKFLSYLKSAYKSGELDFEGKISYLENKKSFQKLLDTLYDKKWVTYLEAPLNNQPVKKAHYTASKVQDDPAPLLRYLSNYVQRAAISNHRIIKVEDGQVTFRWKDYSDGNFNKLMTLDAFEFIRRFLLHILPKGFVKIRQYGILSNRNKKSKLKSCKDLLGVDDIKKPSVKSKSWQDLVEELTGFDPRLCPVCGKGRLIMKETIRPAIHSPPVKAGLAA